MVLVVKVGDFCLFLLGAMQTLLTDLSTPSHWSALLSDREGSFQMYSFAVWLAR